MEAQKIRDSNLTLGKPENWDDTKANCTALPVRAIVVDGLHVIESAWRPTEDEMAELNAGGFVILRVFGQGMIPVQLYVERE